MPGSTKTDVPNNVVEDNFTKGHPREASQETDSGAPKKQTSRLAPSNKRLNNSQRKLTQLRSRLNRIQEDEFTTTLQHALTQLENEGYNFASKAGNDNDLGADLSTIIEKYEYKTLDIDTLQMLATKYPNEPHVREACHKLMQPKIQTILQKLNNYLDQALVAAIHAEVKQLLENYCSGKKYIKNYIADIEDCVNQTEYWCRMPLTLKSFDSLAEYQKKFRERIPAVDEFTKSKRNSIRNEIETSFFDAIPDIITRDHPEISVKFQETIRFCIDKGDTQSIIFTTIQDPINHLRNATIEYDTPCQAELQAILALKSHSSDYDCEELYQQLLDSFCKRFHKENIKEMRNLNLELVFNVHLADIENDLQKYVNDNIQSKSNNLKDLKTPYAFVTKRVKELTANYKLTPTEQLDELQKTINDKKVSTKYPGLAKLALALREKIQESLSEAMLKRLNETVNTAINDSTLELLLKNTISSIKQHIIAAIVAGNNLAMIEKSFSQLITDIIEIISTDEAIADSETIIKKIHNLSEQGTIDDNNLSELKQKLTKKHIDAYVKQKLQAIYEISEDSQQSKATKLSAEKLFESALQKVHADFANYVPFETIQQFLEELSQDFDRIYNHTDDLEQHVAEIQQFIAKYRNMSNCLIFGKLVLARLKPSIKENLFSSVRQTASSEPLDNFINCQQERVVDDLSKNVPLNDVKKWLAPEIEDLNAILSERVGMFDFTHFNAVQKFYIKYRQYNAASDLRYHLLDSHFNEIVQRFLNEYNLITTDLSNQQIVKPALQLLIDSVKEQIEAAIFQGKLSHEIVKKIEPLQNSLKTIFRDYKNGRLSLSVVQALQINFIDDFPKIAELTAALREPFLQPFIDSVCNDYLGNIDEKFITTEEVEKLIQASINDIQNTCNTMLLDKNQKAHIENYIHAYAVDTNTLFSKIHSARAELVRAFQAFSNNYQDSDDFPTANHIIELIESSVDSSSVFEELQPLIECEPENAEINELLNAVYDSFAELIETNKTLSDDDLNSIDACAQLVESNTKRIESQISAFQNDYNNGLYHINEHTQALAEYQLNLIKNNLIGHQLNEADAMVARLTELNYSSLADTLQALITLFDDSLFDDLMKEPDIQATLIFAKGMTFELSGLTKCLDVFCAGQDINSKNFDAALDSIQAYIPTWLNYINNDLKHVHDDNDKEHSEILFQLLRGIITLPLDHIANDMHQNENPIGKHFESLHHILNPKKAKLDAAALQESLAITHELIRAHQTVMDPEIAVETKLQTLKASHALAKLKTPTAKKALKVVGAILIGIAVTGILMSGVIGVGAFCGLWSIGFSVGSATSMLALSSSMLSGVINTANIVLNTSLVLATAAGIGSGIGFFKAKKPTLNRDLNHFFKQERKQIKLIEANKPKSPDKINQILNDAGLEGLVH